MAFKFEQSDETAGAAVRRLAADQLDQAIAELTQPGPDIGKAVHSARKRCKRLRGLFRLVRADFAAYSAENAAVRDAAATLSALRDAEVAGETFGKLREDMGARLEPEAADTIAKALSDRAERLNGELNQSAAIKRAAEALQAVRDRSPGWEIGHDGFRAIGRGFRDTYSRARSDMKRVADRPDDSETFHDWRKQVKYHFMHLCLLRELAPHMTEGQRKLANELGEVLGDHHDVAVFETLLEEEREIFADAVAMRQGLREREERLASHALGLGRELLGEKPKALARRMETYWHDWRAAAPAEAS